VSDTKTDTSAPAPKEEGFAKDSNKLIRRLSLVALLLSRTGRPVTVNEIRTTVEGYPGMTDDAFKRRFYEDRDELAELGIAITSQRDDSGGDLYSLAASSYYLPPFSFSPDEVTALAACLLVLGDRFAYSKPLRLALLSLAQGRPELLSDEAIPTLAVIPDGAAQPGAKLLPKLQNAIADRKTVTFDYYAISRGEEKLRTVDPYGLHLVGDEWYLIGRCHERNGIRIFKLSRIRGKIRHATRAPHDFDIPDDFSLTDYRDRPPWQLGESQATAAVQVDATMAWWVEAHYGHRGAVTPGDDGGIDFATPYCGARALTSWTLGLGAAATVVAPPELRDGVAAQLRTLIERLEDPPAVGAAATPAAPRPPKRAPAKSDWRVEVDRFTRLTALGTYLIQHCDEEGEASLSIADICRDLATDKATLKEDVRLLCLVNFGADGALLYAELKGRRVEVICDLAGPTMSSAAQLSPLQADTLLLAIELVGSWLPSASQQTLADARAKLQAARRPGATTLAAGNISDTPDEVISAMNTAICEHRLLEIDYWSEGSNKTSTRRVEPHLMIRSRGEWYAICYCLRSEGIRAFRVSTTKKAELLKAHFTPRAERELEIYRREGIPISTDYAAGTVKLWYSATVSRWVAERQPVTMLSDGACLAIQPYVDESWLIHHLLRFGGEALPVGAPELSDRLHAAAADLLQRYERQT